MCEVHGCRCGWRAWDAERCLHHKPHCDVAECAVGMSSHVAVGDQMVSILEVPNKIYCIRGLQVLAWVVKLYIKDDVEVLKKDVFLCDVYCFLLGNIHSQRDFICVKREIRLRLSLRFSFIKPQCLVPCGAHNWNITAFLKTLLKLKNGERSSVF